MVPLMVVVTPPPHSTCRHSRLTHGVSLPPLPPTPTKMSPPTPLPPAEVSPPPALLLLVSPPQSQPETASNPKTKHALRRIVHAPPWTPIPLSRVRDGGPLA